MCPPRFYDQVMTLRAAVLLALAALAVHQTLHAGREVLACLLTSGGSVDAGLLLVVLLAAVAGAAAALALHRAGRLLDDASAVVGRGPRLRVAVVHAVLDVLWRPIAT